ncbi:type VI secretion system membrane subunit TssM [Pseudomonas gingeri]|uniref:type VI secretion system membrane subunit TssM n=3 Tax=Pseudomonas gingeri TaxID=117681 RepID=UPI0015A28BBE|nr:type VI secretion system membrane subunit TssM [Pseudomonas gingeri]NWD08201.1 type VI secretion system membrane subunit TssM [Pseudomonas gingeri]NWE36631.1 type VI secretion system membrane subunit TssM [Pseudomonas gingeri]NWE57804.1 type VI secretion system membrane subunit TssM [Pseudomonas gingeri]NWF02184.1 type VI secretion system membrane subunit TssM [Pseudomonas gingeri]
MINLWKNIGVAATVAQRQLHLAMPVMVLLGMLIALLGIWWLGPHWTWEGHQPLAGLSMRVTASVVVIILPLLIWAFRVHLHHRRWQAERRLATAMETDPCLKVIEEQQRSLDDSLAALRKKLAHGDIYRLPWYLLLGAENAGKTSLVARPGHNVPLSDPTRRFVGTSWSESDKRDSVQWWLGHEAVLIDTPGTFVTQLEQEGGAPSLHARRWQHLLGWLGEKRSRRPLNGVVLAIDLAQLIAQPLQERRNREASIRSRLEELTQQLGVRLPVYVVLSKIDLLEGFEEFLGRMPASVRDEVMGFTFSLDSVDSHDAWLEEFDHQYASFVTRFNEHMLDALGDPVMSGQRHKLLAVSRQLSGVRHLLSAYLLGALSGGQHTQSALVRGVYFSSVCQQGVLLDWFVETSGKSQELAAPIVGAKPAGGNLVYFSGQLFQRVIYPEAGLAGDNIKVARSKRRLLAAGFGVATLGCLLAVSLWQFYFTVNRDKAITVLAKSQEFSAQDIDVKIDTTGRNLLAPLDQIRDALSVYGNYREVWPLVSDMGLYQGQAIGPTVDEAYLTLLSKRFLPAIAVGVLEAINAAPAGSNQQLAALRVYRMLEDRHNRRPAIVENWVARQWQRAYPGQGQVQTALMRHLHYALKYADADLPQHRERILQVQQQLRQQPMAERVYQSLKQDAQEQLPRPLDLRNEVGPAFDIVYRSSASESAGNGLLLAPLLTAKGFRDYFEPGTQDIIELAVIDQWVLGERQRLDYSEEDRKLLTQRIRALYSDDYIESWRRALNQFSITDFRDLSHGVRVLEQVTGPAAPLRRLLETVRDNTVIYSFEPLLEGQALADNMSPGQQQAAGIRRAFSSLSELIAVQGERPSYYEQTLRSLSAVYDYTKTVHDNPDPGKAALKAVLNRFTLGGSDPIANLQRVAVGLPEPLNQHVKKLADQTSQVLVIAALRELEKHWDGEIYSFYRERLANRYPFKPGGEDASLEDFEAFFGPQGRLQQFHDQYLSVFLKDNLDALYSESHGGYLVRDDVLEQLKKAERIRDTFFNHRGALAVQLSIEPLALSVSRRSSMLSIDGQLIPYEHGAAQRTGLIWPNSLGKTSASQLTLVHSTGNTASLGFRGPWSLFRLLSRGQLNGRTATSVDLTFVVADGLMRYRIGAEKANNPITQRSFEGFVLPRTLLEERRQKKTMETLASTLLRGCSRCPIQE